MIFTRHEVHDTRDAKDMDGSCGSAIYPQGRDQIVRASFIGGALVPFQLYTTVNQAVEPSELLRDQLKSELVPTCPGLP